MTMMMMHENDSNGDGDTNGDKKGDDENGDKNGDKNSDKNGDDKNGLGWQLTTSLASYGAKGTTW